MSLLADLRNIPTLASAEEFFLRKAHNYDLLKSDIDKKSVAAFGHTLQVDSFY
jgi:hypothetical protein